MAIYGGLLQVGVPALEGGDEDGGEDEEGNRRPAGWQEDAAEVAEQKRREREMDAVAREARKSQGAQRERVRERVVCVRVCVCAGDGVYDCDDMLVFIYCILLYMYMCLTPQVTSCKAT